MSQTKSAPTRGGALLATFLVGVLSWSSQLAAWTQNRSINSLSSTREKGDHLNTQGFLAWEVTQYVGSLPGSNVQASEGALVHTIGQVGSNSTQWGWDLFGGAYTNLGSSFFYGNELFGKAHWEMGGVPLSLTLGRKKQDWAVFDRVWDLGLWEPLALWDPLRPLRQGLTGFFLSGALFEQSVEFTLFYSPIFVPTMGPQIEEKDGSLTAASRWYRSPVEAGPVLSRQTRLAYQLEIPEMAKLASQTSYGATVSWKNPAGWWSQLSWATKPINQLQIAYDYNLLINPNDSQAQITVSPFVLRHEVGTFEMGYKNFVLGAFYDRPSWEAPRNSFDDQGVPMTDWIRQSPEPLQGYHVTWSQLWNPSWSSEVSVLNVQTMDTMDRDASGRVRGSLFPDRFNWLRAAQLRLRWDGRIAKTPVGLNLRGMREFNQRGGLISAGLNLGIARNLWLYSQVDILGVDDSSLENTSPGFFNQFRSNDRICSGITYVF